MRVLGLLGLLGVSGLLGLLWSEKGIREDTRQDVGPGERLLERIEGEQTGKDLGQGEGRKGRWRGGGSVWGMCVVHV